MSAELHEGRCHCGGVRFRVRLTGGLAAARRCTCSFCAMRGAVALTAALDGLEILQGADRLTLYQFNSGTARHYFCSVCGIYTHHQRRSNPKEYGINMACLDGMSPFDLPSVAVCDGRHHPSDGHPDRIVGWLRFEPANERRAS